MYQPAKKVMSSATQPSMYDQEKRQSPKRLPRKLTVTPV